MDELAALVKLDSDYRNTSLFCFTETWLTEDITVCLDGFTFIRFDRDKEVLRISSWKEGSNPKE